MAGRRKKQINIVIGHNIRTLRTENGMTREAFAEAVGISSRFLVSVETGFAGISIDTLKRICDYFAISADTILYGNDVGPTSRFDALLAGVDACYYPTLAASLREQIKLIKLVEITTKKSQKDA